MNRLFAALGVAAFAVVGSSATTALAAPILHYYAPIFNSAGQQVGSVNFVPQDQGGAEMVLTTNGLPPGRYNVVISDQPGCPSETPTTLPLGQAAVDLGMLRVDPAGNGAVTAYVSTLMTPNALVGHTVLIGRNLVTPTGAPVTPTACGAIGNS